MTESTSNKITQEQVNNLLDNAPRQHAVFFSKDMVVSYLLPNGFSVIGRAACVDPANFDLELGFKYCREDAERHVWLLLGYELQQRLHEERLNANER